MLLNPPTTEEIKRFNSKWEKRGDCHIWTAFKDRDGYGHFLFRRAQRKAHRVALFLSGRPIPEGHVVNHICQNRAIARSANPRKQKDFGQNGKLKAFLRYELKNISSFRIKVDRSRIGTIVIWRSFANDDRSTISAGGAL